MKTLIWIVLGGLTGCFLGWLIAFALCNEDRFGLVQGTFTETLQSIEELLTP